ncbi:MAG: glycine--tRNA ligase [Opitutae bacterium]|nr:glycine--tRNA ligase [Opitutae bacterium]
MSTSSTENPNLMEALVSLAKRRGFIYQSSEIYGGLNGFFDYGPLGVELKRNIRECWWRDMVHRRDDVVGIETSIIMHPKVWEASGHVAGFTDPLVDCKVSKQRYRADQLFYARVEQWVPLVTPDPFNEPGKPVNLEVKEERILVGYVSHLEESDTEGKLFEAAQKLAKSRKFAGAVVKLADLNMPTFISGGRSVWVVLPAKEFTEATEAEIPLIPSPATGEPGSLTPPRAFNMMFETNVGALKDASSVAYLRPETAQGMFVDFKNVVDTTRVKLPFGIAQIGKSFRNEITPRNFIFRSREFEQMEMEYFIHPDADWLACHEEWLKWCQDWLKSIGLPESHLSLHEHPKEKLAFYSRRTVDIMFKYPFGVQELWGIAARSDYDLQQHQKFSGVPQVFFDEAAKAKVVPHVIEPAVGVDRIFLAVLASAYAVEDVKDEKGNVEQRTVLRLSPRIAPTKVAVLPLLKNKDVLTTRAKALYTKLKKRYAVQYDDGGAIGKRYRRQDEAGTPWCVTIDFDTIEKPGDTFTLRERDSMSQKRITEAELFALLEEQVY